jgi:hypothetical protein
MGLKIIEFKDAGQRLDQTLGPVKGGNDDVDFHNEVIVLDGGGIRNIFSTKSFLRTRVVVLQTGDIVLGQETATGYFYEDELGRTSIPDPVHSL